MLNFISFSNLAQHNFIVSYNNSIDWINSCLKSYHWLHYLLGYYIFVLYIGYIARNFTTSKVLALQTCI